MKLVEVIFRPAAPGYPLVLDLETGEDLSSRVFAIEITPDAPGMKARAGLFLLRDGAKYIDPEDPDGKPAKEWRAVARIGGEWGVTQ